MFGSRNFNVFTHRSTSNPVFGILRPNEMTETLTTNHHKNDPKLTVEDLLAYPMQLS